MARTNAKASVKLLLEVTYNDKVLHQSPVNFKKGIKDISLSIKLPIDNLIEDKKDVVLNWIVKDAPASENMLTVDDSYFTPVQVSLDKIYC